MVKTEIRIEEFPRRENHKLDEGPVDTKNLLSRGLQNGRGRDSRTTCGYLHPECGECEVGQPEDVNAKVAVGNRSLQRYMPSRNTELGKDAKEEREEGEIEPEFPSLATPRWAKTRSRREKADHWIGKPTHSQSTCDQELAIELGGPRKCQNEVVSSDHELVESEIGSPYPLHTWLRLWMDPGRHRAHVLHTAGLVASPLLGLSLYELSLWTPHPASCLGG